MNAIVIVDSFKLTEDDLDFLNSCNEHGVVFTTLDSNNFLSDSEIQIIIELTKNLAYSATYEALKYILLKVLIIIRKKLNNAKNNNAKNNNDETKIEIQYNGNEFLFYSNFSLTQEQNVEIVEKVLNDMMNHNV